MRLRETLGLHKELAARLSDLEQKIESHDEGIRTLFEAIRQLMAPSERTKCSIGFRIEGARPAYRVRRPCRKGARLVAGR